MKFSSRSIDLSVAVAAKALSSALAIKTDQDLSDSSRREIIAPFNQKLHWWGEKAKAKAKAKAKTSPKRRKENTQRKDASHYALSHSFSPSLFNFLSSCLTYNAVLIACNERQSTREQKHEGSRAAALAHERGMRQWGRERENSRTVAIAHEGTCVGFCTVLAHERALQRQVL